MERSEEPQSFFARTRFWFAYAFSEHYVDFKGRASLREYWYFSLASFVLSWTIPLVPILFKAPSDVDRVILLLPTWIIPVVPNLNEMFGFIMSSIYLLVILPVSFCLTVRRLHDTNRSGWMQLLLLIPIAGPFILLYYIIQPGTPGPNVYGSNTVLETYEFGEEPDKANSMDADSDG